jgi:A/G-specific adenine glycosylase
MRAIQQRLTPPSRAGDYAQAMMDLGAAICTPKKPACSLCPLDAACLAHARREEELFPLRTAKAERPTRYGEAFVVSRSDGAVLLRRRAENGLLGGMTEVPGSEWTSHASDVAPLADAPVEAAWRRVPGTVVHVFTHFRLELSVYCAEASQVKKAPAGCWWAAGATLASEALPSVMRKVIEAALPGATRRQKGERAA